MKLELPIHRSRSGAFAILAALFVSSAALLAADWPQWRGPTRDGIVPAAAAPRAWPEELTKSWSQSVGIGHSSPIVAEGRVFQHSRQGEEEIVQAFDLLKGTPLWKKSYSAPYEVDSAAAEHGKGPKSTPTCSAGRLYTLSINGRLTCWDAVRGTLVWEHNFGRDFPKPSPQFGTATSPLIVGGMCIVHGGGAEGGTLAAFDSATGEVKWSRKGTGPAYASPIVVKLDGVEQLVTQIQDACLSVDLRTGRDLWTLPLTTEYEQNCISPVALDEKTILFGGYHQPTFAVVPRLAAGKWSPTRLWKNADIPLYMNTPVVSERWFFGMTQKRAGQLFCADSASGKVQWTNDGRFGDNASLLIAGDFLLALSTDAKLLVLEKNPRQLKVVRTYQVAENPTWASPALSGSSLLIKDLESLTCYSLSK